MGVRLAVYTLICSHDCKQGCPQLCGQNDLHSLMQISVFAFPRTPSSAFANAIKGVRRATATLIRIHEFG